MTQPYETERQAREAARHILDSPPGTGAWSDGNRQLLEDACRAAGVQFGAYDYRILLWLAGWEPSTCAVIAGWITRAGAGRPSPGQLAAVLDALDFAADELRDRVANCGDCDQHPAGLCETCANRLARAEGWDKTAGALRGQR
jgi:hypothetical protein